MGGHEVLMAFDPAPHGRGIPCTEPRGLNRSCQAMAQEGSLPLQKAVEPLKGQPLSVHPVDGSEDLKLGERRRPKGVPEDPTGEDFLFGVGEGTAMME